MRYVITLSIVASLLLVAMPAQAQAAPKVAVIGDSLSHEYRCKPRGNATSFNWVEILERIGNVDFGTGSPCYSNVFANSGSTIQQQMNGQVTSAINAFNAGNADHVIILLGSNDILGGVSVSTLITTYSAQIDRLLTVYEPQNILASGLPQNDCGSNNANINSFNVQLQSLALSKGIVYGDISQFCILLNSYQVNPSTYNYGGQTVDRWAWCHINCLRLPNDGHPGTIAQAILANAVMASFVGASPVSEAEVLALMGIGSSSTSTSTLTPTVTRTPTVTNTPMPTFTPTPHILDCGTGKHWIPLDAQRVECVPNSAIVNKPKALSVHGVQSFAGFGFPRCDDRPCKPKPEYTDKTWVSKKCPKYGGLACPFVP